VFSAPLALATRAAVAALRGGAAGHPPAADLAIAAASAGTALLDRRAVATQVVEAALGRRVADVAAAVGHAVGADVGEAIARATVAVLAAAHAIGLQGLAPAVFAALARAARPAARAAAAIEAADLAGAIGGAEGRDTEGRPRALRLVRNVDGVHANGAGSVLLAFGVAGAPGRRNIDDPSPTDRLTRLRDIADTQLAGDRPRTGHVRGVRVRADRLPRADALQPAIDALPVLAGLLVAAYGAGNAGRTAAGRDGKA
jgi:hypothetical protein